MAKGETYEQFTEKFIPKRTTDDCYTPPQVYEALLQWAVSHLHLEGRPVVRPFYPGGDYEHYPYPDGCVVIDNPPFSIYAKIVRFYLDRLEFVRLSPLGEGKDMTDPKDVGNIEKKKKRGVTGYNVYKINDGVNEWLVKMEISKGRMETVYHVKKMR